jgi:hypothetical protein
VIEIHDVDFPLRKQTSQRKVVRQNPILSCCSKGEGGIGQTKAEENIVRTDGFRRRRLIRPITD